MSASESDMCADYENIPIAIDSLPYGLRLDWVYILNYNKNLKIANILHLPPIIS